MIDSGYVRLMATYNAAMNQRIYAAAGRLPDAARRAARGTFWGSIHGTLNHLLWADRQWMARLDGWPKPVVGLADSAALIADFADLSDARLAADADLGAWAWRIAPDWLAGELAWFSGAAGRDVRAARAKAVVHLFNHQTHHRGQVHAMLTAAGESCGDTDLFLVVPD